MVIPDTINFTKAKIDSLHKSAATIKKATMLNETTENFLKVMSTLRLKPDECFWADVNDYSWHGCAKIGFNNIQ